MIRARAGHTLTIAVLVLAPLTDMSRCNAYRAPVTQAALPADTTAPIAFVDVTTLPMTGDTLLEHQTVVLRNGRIDRVGAVADVALGGDVVRIDGRNRYLMPGLADLHTHLRYAEDLLLYAAAGVTTVLNLGQPITNPLLQLKADVARGAVLGPTIYASGIRIDGRPGAFDPAAPYLVRTPEEAITEVRRQHAAGFQFIKAYSFLPADAYLAIMAEAERLHMPVVGHVPHAVGVLAVLRGGQRMIVHSEEYLIGPRAAAPDSTGRPSTAPRREYDFSRIPEMVRATRDAGVVVCPTLSTQENIAAQWGRPAARDSLLRQPEVAYARPEWQESWRTTTRYVGQSTPFEPRLSFQRALVRELFRAGVPLTLGTDSPGNPVMPPGSSLHADLEALVRAGVSPLGALRAGTRNASDFMNAALPGSPAFGAIEVGRVADLVLLDANPLRDVRLVRRQVGVVVHGRWLTHARLQEMVTKQAMTWGPVRP